MLLLLQVTSKSSIPLLLAKLSLANLGLVSPCHSNVMFWEFLWVCGAKPLPGGCCCGSWSFAIPAWDELSSTRGHLQEDFVGSLANVGGNGEKTSENPFSPWGKHRVRDGMGWEWILGM